MARNNKLFISLKKKLVPILKKNGVVKAGIFGSYARGDFTKKSDVDILIKFKGRKSLFDLAHLELELEKKLKKKVDVLTYNSLNPLIKERVLGEEVLVL
ncbi:nucleotidyltransferase domain-containing protein [Candidatus Woesearchaeota archaeon]|nr:nucleotidyltransferase domain-containing protein [Candidatus Woesearchaeota archaeon]